MTNLNSQVPTAMVKSLGQAQALFIIEATRSMSPKSAYQTTLFFLLLLPLPLHLMLVIVFQHYKANFFSNSHQFTSTNTFQMIDTSLGMGTQIALLLGPFTFFMLFIYLIYVGLREIISPSHTVWLGTAQKLMVMKNNKEISSYPWEDFWGIVSYKGDNIKGNITLWYTLNKPFPIKQHEPHQLNIFETQHAIDVSNTCRAYIQMALNKNIKHHPTQDKRI